MFRNYISVDLEGLPHAKQIGDIIDQLMLTEEQLVKVKELMCEEMLCGLSIDEKKRKRTSLQMENTFVRSLLDGTETGEYLALDLGGTNFRVLFVRMVNGVCTTSTSRNYNVPKEKLTGPAVGVFDHLAASIYKFLEEEKLLTTKLPLGFTFSFPMVQKSIKTGILVTWTKSFACTDGVGQDAVKLLEEAVARQPGLHVEVVAILNDTTGTLLAGSYNDKNCQIGLIMGTGCNVAYLDTIRNVENWKPIENDTSNQVIIDTECGAFGDNGILDAFKTEFDAVIDNHSHHKGSFTFEKLFSGHYIGDIARLVLLDLTKKGLIFQGTISKRLNEWKSLTAKHLSNIERDTDENLSNTQQMLEDLDLMSVANSYDIRVVRYVCSVMSIRAAQFVCTVLSGVLEHINHPKTMTIAIDGSLYRQHPKIHDIMMSCLDYLSPNTKVTLIDAADGSGKGAAFVAAVAVHTLHTEKK